MQVMSVDQKPDAWSEIASHYEATFESLTLQYAHRVAEVLRIRPGVDVIDIAAGTGAFSLLLARQGANVLATDFAPGMIARLEDRISAENLANIRAAVMDGQALEVPDGSFDISVSILGLIFFPDIKQGFLEMKRVLRPGGRAAVVCWGDPRNFMLKNLVMDAVKTAVPHFQPPTQPPVWARLVGAESLERHLGEAGFRQVNITTVTGYLPVRNPQEFWDNFVKRMPPLAYLFGQFDTACVDKIGQVFIEGLAKVSPDGIPTVTAEACVGLGVA
jgi:ubiquinone/menaquinone biosynthesis C-methylase UbiE